MWFNIFKSKKNNLNIEAMIIYYFRSETGKLLGLEPNSKEFNEDYQSAGEVIETTLLSLLDKKILKGISDTLASVSTNRHEEMFGACMILLFYRVCFAQKGIQEGTMKEEEVTADILATATHDQIIGLIKHINKSRA